MKNIEGLGIRVGEGIFPEQYRVCLEVPVSKEVWEDFCDARRDDLNVFGHVLKARMSVALERILEELIPEEDEELTLGGDDYDDVLETVEGPE